MVGEFRVTVTDVWVCQRFAGRVPILRMGSGNKWETDVVVGDCQSKVEVNY